MVAQMVDEFTVYVEMTDDEVAAHEDRALSLVKPRLRVFEMTHAVNNVAQGIYHNVSVDDLRVRFEYDEDADLSYIERFDSEDEYNEWIEREGAFNKAPRFKSNRPETRRFDGWRFECLYTFGAVVDEKGYHHTQGQWRIGEYRIVKLLPWDRSKQPIIRLAHVSEVLADFDEYMSGHGDLDNYLSFGAILERRTEYKINRYGDDISEWEVVDSIWGIDFYIGGDEYERTPDSRTYTLDELKHEPFKWVASEHFGIDFDQVPD